MFRHDVAAPRGLRLENSNGCGVGCITDVDLEKGGEIYFKGYPGLMITGNAESQFCLDSVFV